MNKKNIILNTVTSFLIIISIIIGYIAFIIKMLSILPIIDTVFIGCAAMIVVCLILRLFYMMLYDD